MATLELDGTLIAEKDNNNKIISHVDQLGEANTGDGIKLNNSLKTSTGTDIITSTGSVSPQGSFVLPSVTTESNLDPNLPEGSLIYLQDAGGDLIFKDQEGYKKLTSPLGSLNNPAASATAIINAGDSTGDGLYYISSTSGVIQVYCMMSWGGYMLVAKISNQNNTNFTYSGSYWSTSSPQNETDTQDLTGNTDCLNRLYYEYFIQVGFRFSLNTVSNYISDTAGGSALNKTAKQCFTGSSLTSDNNRSTFLSWINNAGTSSSNWDNQANCNHTGFNISGSAYAMRYGINMNNEADCASNDSGIGFGGYTNNQYTAADGIRNAQSGGWRWSSDVRYPYNGFIWVK